MEKIMNMFKNLLVASAAILAVSGTAVGASAVDPTMTAAQHQALAREFGARAADATDKAAAHEAMARTYRIGGPPKGAARAMTGHCERLVRSYRAEAAGYEARASEQSRLAAEAR
jgi:hypothetical protein